MGAAGGAVGRLKIASNWWNLMQSQDLMQLRYIAIAAPIVCLLSAALLFNEFHAYSSDAGQHYALVRALMDLHGWGSPPSTPNLGPLPLYPPLSHWLAAEVGKLVGSGLRGMTVVASASVALFYLAMFVMSAKISWRVPIIACLMTIGYALLRGPVFGRMVVNNYFYAQAVGSAFAAVVLLVALIKFHKWNGWLIDLFVLIAGQILVATHLMPAAQLLACYCTILLVYALTRSRWQIVGRLVLFSGVSLALIFKSPFASTVYLIAQAEGGAHINLFGNRLAQILLLAAGATASIRLIWLTRRQQDAGMFLGCMGLATCGLALLQIGLFWLGFGSNYAIAKHMFVVVALFIFVLAANIALKISRPGEVNKLGGATMSVVWCSVLALLATRADLYPSLLDLDGVVKFQNAARDLSSRLDSSDQRRPIALASQWPLNLSYGITIGDLGLAMSIADQMLLRKPLPVDRVSMVFMPADDPALTPQCLVEAYSNQLVAASDYACYLRNMPSKR
jgi:hypothetical protein